MIQLFDYQQLIGKTIKEFPGFPENSEDLVIFFEDNTFAILSSYADMDSHQHSNFYVSDCLSNWQKKELGFITFEEYRKLEQASRKEDAITQLAWLKREHPDLF